MPFLSQTYITCSILALNEICQSDPSGTVVIALGPVQEKCDLVLSLHHFHELFGQVSFELSFLIYYMIGDVSDPF